MEQYWKTIYLFDKNNIFEICDLMVCSLHVFMKVFEGLFGCKFMAKACHLGRLGMIASASIVTTHTYIIK